MLEIFDILFKDGRELEINQGDTLFHTGDAAKSMYLVLKGRVDLVRHARAGTRLVLARAEATQILAEASAYSNAYHCDAVAIEPSRVKSVSKSSFKQRLNNDPETATHWAAYLARATQNARMLSEIRNLRTVADRLDAWLGFENKLPPKGEWLYLADTLGVSKEALYRELSNRRN